MTFVNVQSMNRWSTIDIKDYFVKTLLFLLSVKLQPFCQCDSFDEATAALTIRLTLIAMITWHLQPLNAEAKVPILFLTLVLTSQCYSFSLNLHYIFNYFIKYSTTEIHFQLLGKVTDISITFHHKCDFTISRKINVMDISKSHANNIRPLKLIKSPLKFKSVKTHNF